MIKISYSQLLFQKKMVIMKTKKKTNPIEYKEPILHGCLKLPIISVTFRNIKISMLF